MNEEMIDLSHRVVACKSWRWLPGMRASWIGMDTGWRILSHSDSWYEAEKKWIPFQMTTLFA